MPFRRDVRPGNDKVISFRHFFELFLDSKPWREVNFYFASLHGRKRMGIDIGGKFRLTNEEKQDIITIILLIASRV